MPPTKQNKSKVQRVVVTDLENRRYTLAHFIGQGGQGSVYAVKEGRLAVKLLHSTHEAERERLRRCLQAVKRLDLAGLPIASPTAILRPPHVGYLMPLAAGLSPLHSFSSPPSTSRSVSQWYVATGGLQRRLRCLGAAANVFARLHGRGLAYGDPSPANILVTPIEETPSAFLIDADNLHTSGAAARAAIYTPCYGAPELMRGQCFPSTLTDAFALAVIAFEVLSLIHPFVGDTIHDGEPELEERAYHGDFPWIEHSADASNRASRGINRQLILSPGLRRLFQRTFEPGLADPSVRPAVMEWAEAFCKAADITVACPRCQASYYAPGAQACPWCADPAPALGYCRLLLWDPEGAHGKMNDALVKHQPSNDKPPRERSLAHLALPARTPAQILGRHIVSDAPPSQAEQPLVAATWMGGNSLHLQNLSQQDFLLVRHTESKTIEHAFPAGTEQKLPISSKQTQWQLHFAPLNTLHRVAVFNLPCEP